MTKTKLIASVSESSTLSQREVRAVLDRVLSEIEISLKKGEKVALTGFGTFKTVQRKARTGRNPRTGAPLKIPARAGLKFFPGKSLRKTIALSVGPGQS